MIKQSTFQDQSTKPSTVEIQLHGAEGHYRVSVSSKTDDDMNFTYRFSTKPEAIGCYNVECERFKKMGLEMISEVEYAKPTKENK